MRRRFAVLITVLAVTLVVSAPAAQAGPVFPYNSHPYGHSYPEWFRIVGQFYLGDASNPLFAGLLEGDCGQRMGKVFVMAAPIDVGQVFNCKLPLGAPIVLSHAAFFATQGIDGETDAELQAAVEAGFTFTSNSLTLDGKALPLKAIDTGAYDIIAAPGSFYDTIFGLTGTVRTAIRGNVVVLHPLHPGDHTIKAEVTFTGTGGAFSATYHVHVG